jgi:hypothetical protein
MNGLPPSETDMIRTEMRSNYTGDIEPLAFRVAACLIIANSILSLLCWLMSYRLNTLSLVIDIFLIFTLFKMRPGARTFTLWRAYLGAVLMPILFFVMSDVSSAIINTIIQVAYSGSLILLLQSETRKWKIFTAIGVYAVLSFGFTIVLLVVAILSQVLTS